MSVQVNLDRALKMIEREGEKPSFTQVKPVDKPF